MNDTDQCGTMTIGVTNSLIRNRIKDECKDVLFNSRQCIIKWKNCILSLRLLRGLWNSTQFFNKIRYLHNNKIGCSIKLLKIRLNLNFNFGDTTRRFYISR